MPPKKASKAEKTIDVCIMGTGEYTTGYVPGEHGAAPDKKIGPCGMTAFDLRRRGKVDRILFAGTDGTKFPEVRKLFDNKILKGFKGFEDVSFEGFPSDHVASDREAYLKALATIPAGSFVIVFTPDNTHMAICKAALDQGMHVLCTKPMVKTLEEHRILAKLAQEKQCLLSMEFHKRFDPIYNDAAVRAASYGDFSYYYSYMSQPKKQLHTFAKWAGKASDISFYLNSHHIDILCFMLEDRAKPLVVSAIASRGIAEGEPFNYEFCEDTITVTVVWENLQSKSTGTSVHTASWAAPNKAEVHSQQRFHYMGSTGEINADQAHRGYTFNGDDHPHTSQNPMFFRILPGADGSFAGQGCYGYKSIEACLDASIEINEGKRTAVGNKDIPCADALSTLFCTAILEAGRRSLDNSGKQFAIQYDQQGWPCGFI